MTPAQRRSLVRRLHRWLGALTGLLVLLVTVTGILLHRPGWLGPPTESDHCLAADPTDPDRLLKGGRWGLHESTDGGTTWRELPLISPPADVRRIVFLAGARGDGMVWALGAQSGVVSADGGRIWRDMDLPPLPGGEEYLDLTVSLTGTLTLMTTEGIHARQGQGAWQRVGDVARPGGAQRLVHDLHTGQVAGLVGRRVVELGGWGLLVLTVTGLALYVRVRRRQS